MTRIKNRSYSIGIPILLIFASCSWDQLNPKIDCSIAPIRLDLVETIAAECSNATGSIVVLASGGDGDFEYILGNLRSQDGVFQGLSSGIFTVKAIDGTGCSEELSVTIDNTEGVNLTNILTTDAGCGTSNGSIEIEVAGGSGPYSYSLNNGQPQASNIFNNLARGSYTVAIQDQGNCTTTGNANILSGVSFNSSVKNIISTNCAISGCHNGSTFPDLRSFANIQSNASSIKSRTANGSMPKGRTLTAQEKSLIACWVDDGALNN
jgi:hypothetical protein